MLLLSYLKTDVQRGTSQMEHLMFVFLLVELPEQKSRLERFPLTQERLIGHQFSFFITEMTLSIFMSALGFLMKLELLMA